MFTSTLHFLDGIIDLFQLIPQALNGFDIHTPQPPYKHKFETDKWLYTN